MENKFSYLKKLGDKNSKTIIFLHGVGSNKEDLFGIKDFFSLDYNIFSLNGFYDLGNSRNAWYHLSFLNGKTIYSFNEVENSYNFILDFIEYLKKEYEINEEIYLLGFSQGAIMSNFILNKSPEEISGIISLSGRLLSEINDLNIHTHELKKKKIFIGHGMDDNVINIEEFDELKDFYINLGLNIAEKSYNMDHTIIKEEIKDIVGFLE